MSRLPGPRAGGFVITDGGWGTALQARGLPLGQPADAWNLDRPGEVEAVARAFVAAGAAILLTNTFQANEATLGDSGRMAEVNRRGVAIARAAAGDRARVFGSIGPIADGETAEAYRRQAAVLADAGVEALVLETFSHPDNARLALGAARSVGLPTVLCASFGFGPGGDRTSSEATPEEIARLALDGGADAVGANCGSGPAGVAELVRRLRAAGPLPVWIRPNAGLPTISDGRAVYAMTPDAFAAYLPEWLDAGATFIGGCCGTGPDHIRALAARAGLAAIG